jgi:hypothetical protein
MASDESNGESEGHPRGGARGRTSAPDPDAPDLVQRLGSIARGTLEVGVGLGVLGLLSYRAERPRWEAELERLGLGPAAELSRWTGGLLDRGVLRLLGQR